MASEAFDDSDWAGYFEITSDNLQVDEAVGNLLFDLADAPAAFWSAVKSDGGDIRVTNNAGTTAYSFEVGGDFDAVSELGTLYFDSALLSTSTDITWRVYAGNAAVSLPSASDTLGRENVWNNESELAVYHLEESPTGTILDSGPNNYDCSSEGSMASGDLVAAQVGKGLEFDGTNDALDTPDDTASSSDGALSFADDEDWTVTLWYAGTDTEQNGDWGKTLLGRDHGDLWSALVLRNGKAEYLHHNSSWQHNLVSSGSVADGSPHRITYVNHSDETGDLYVDGAAEVTGSSSAYDAAKYFTINKFMLGYQGKYTSGILDEVRLVGQAKSANWESTHYANQNDPASFWTTGSWQSPSAASLCGVRLLKPI